MFKEFLKEIVSIIVIISPLLPLIPPTIKLIGQKTRNQKMINLSYRAQIIVNGIEQLPIKDGTHKANEATSHLVDYANEVGIDLTVEQAMLYIENAVRIMNQETERNGM